MISTFCSSISQGRFRGKGRTLGADQVSDSTLPCCKRLVAQRIGPAHNGSGQLHQVLHGLSEAGAKHFQIVPSVYRLRRSRSVQVALGVFHLCKIEVI